MIEYKNLLFMKRIDYSNYINILYRYLLRNIIIFII